MCMRLRMYLTFDNFDSLWKHANYHDITSSFNSSSNYNIISNLCLILFDFRLQHSSCLQKVDHFFERLRHSIYRRSTNSTVRKKRPYIESVIYTLHFGESLFVSFKLSVYLGIFSVQFKSNLCLTSLRNFAARVLNSTGHVESRNIT